MTAQCNSWHIPYEYFWELFPAIRLPYLKSAPSSFSIFSCSLLCQGIMFLFHFRLWWSWRPGTKPLQTLFFPGRTSELFWESNTERAGLGFKISPGFLSGNFRGSSFRSPWSCCSSEVAPGPRARNSAAAEHQWTFSLVSSHTFCTKWEASSHGQNRLQREIQKTKTHTQTADVFR